MPADGSLCVFICFYRASMECTLQLKEYTLIKKKKEGKEEEKKKHTPTQVPYVHLGKHCDFVSLWALLAISPFRMGCK